MNDEEVSNLIDINTGEPIVLEGVSREQLQQLQKIGRQARRAAKERQDMLEAEKAILRKAKDLGW